ncbi:MAG: 2-oxo acid dehydrogenase subunit E2 [Mobilitalea sp.]
MSNIVVLPKLGLTMEHGLIMGWSKNEGDIVRKGDVLFQVESDKAVVDVESDYDGILLKIYHKDGEDVPCGNTIAIIGKAGETIPDAIAPIINASKHEVAVEKQAEKITQEVNKDNEKIIASPRAKRLAVKENVDLALVGPGSGDNGRIKEREVLLYIKNKLSGKDIKISPVARNILEDNQLTNKDIRGTGPEGRIMKLDVLESLRTSQTPNIPGYTTEAITIPITAIRETIAKRLTESKRYIPHYYITVAVDMYNFIESRKVWNTANPEKKVSLNAMIMKIVASGLKKHPLVNSSWTKDGIMVYPNANIALAVSTEKGLITPVVRYCELKSIVKIEEELADLIARARLGQLKLEEFSGSTCTISNLGMYDVEEFSAIINPPEASILAIASIIDTPVAQGQSVAVRPIMRITMSADHRVIDGAASAAFLGDLRAMLEHPFLALF